MEEDDDEDEDNDEQGYCPLPANTINCPSLLLQDPPNPDSSS